jgi:DNA-binding protein H-NS
MAKAKIKTTDETENRITALAEKEEAARLLAMEMAQEREAVKADLRQNVESYLENYGFTVGELFGSARKTRGTAEITYRDPENSENTWTGRGRRPHWLNERLENGETLDQFAITE